MTGGRKGHESRVVRMCLRSGSAESRAGIASYREHKAQPALGTQRPSVTGLTGRYYLRYLVPCWWRSSERPLNEALRRVHSRRIVATNESTDMRCEPRVRGSQVRHKVKPALQPVAACQHRLTAHFDLVRNKVVWERVAASDNTRYVRRARQVRMRAESLVREPICVAVAHVS